MNFHFLTWLAAVMMFGGLGMVFYAARFRTANCPPIASLNPSHWTWKPIWRMRDWYTPKGFRLQLIGWTIFFAGDIIMLFLFVG
jgi:hypothetical protein